MLTGKGLLSAVFSKTYSCYIVLNGATPVSNGSTLRTMNPKVPLSSQHPLAHHHWNKYASFI